MKEKSDKSIELYAKAMLFDHIQRYGSLSSDVGSVLHLLEKIMAEKAVQDKEYDSDFFRCQAVWLKRRADELCEQEEVEWLLFIRFTTSHTFYKFLENLSTFLWFTSLYHFVSYRT